MFKDISDMGSPIGKLKSKFADLSKLLTEYSFGDSSFSPALAKQKIIVTFNEALEIADKCSKTDTIRLYFPSKTVELSVSIAMKTAEYWVDFVLEQGKQFTNSLSMQLMERAKYDLQIQATASRNIDNSENILSNRLPNFVELMNEMSSVITNFHRIADNANRLEYKAPIITYGRTMGYNHYIVEKKTNGDFEMYQITNSNEGKQIRSIIKTFSSDQSFDNYDKMFNEIVTEMMKNPLYLQIAISGF